MRMSASLRFVIVPITVLAFLSAPSFAVEIWVSALSGSDSNGDGSSLNPYKTLTQALGLAGAGDDVRALPGRYDVANGEVFPLAINIGIDLIGTDPRQVIIDGGGDAQGTTNVLLTYEFTRLSHVTVTGSGTGWWNGGVSQFAGLGSESTVENCLFVENERGVYGFDNSTILIRNCVFANNRNDAVSLFNCDDVTVINNSFSLNLKGALLSNCAGEVWNNIIVGSGISGIESDTAFVTSDYNCLWNNARDWTGLSAGADDMIADPWYGRPPQVDFHLMPSTPCNDNADSGHRHFPSADIEGRGRTGPARGAYELLSPGLWVLGLPSIGETITVGIAGVPGDFWFLMMSSTTGQLQTPFGDLLLGFPLIILGQGTATGSGWAGLSGPIPPSTQGTTVYLQTLIGVQLSNRYDLEIF